MENPIKRANKSPATSTLLLGGERLARRAYGFEEIALVPSRLTIDPELVDISWKIGKVKLDIPILASAMDGVVSPKMAVLLSRMGAAGVLNLNGIQTRYDDPDEILKQISEVSREEYVSFMQKVYAEPIKEELVSKRVKEIKKAGALAMVSSVPMTAEKFGRLSAEAGADVFFLQATVTSLDHKGKHPALNLKKFCKSMPIPVVIGNTSTYDVTYEILETGAAAILVGVGPGAACTTRGVLGIGVPMATNIADSAKARDDFYKKTKKYVPIIGDGGMVTAGDICKAIACGADAVMIGSPFARASEAPGRGFHWGMATPNATLPRGTRIKVGNNGSLKEILLGPARHDDGTQNLVGALKTSLGTLGAANLKEMQQVEIIIAPALQTEGKVWQKAQQLGMYR